MQPCTSSSHGRASLGCGRAWQGHNASKCGGCRRRGASEEDQVRGRARAHGSVVQHAQTISTQMRTCSPLGSAPNLPGSPQVPSSLTTQTRQHCLPMTSLAPGSSSMCWGVRTREGTGIWAHRQTVPYGTFQKRTFSRGCVSVCGGVRGFVYRPYKEKMRTGQGPSASWQALGHTLHWAPAP